MPLDITPQFKFSVEEKEFTVTADPNQPGKAYCRSGQHARVCRVQNKIGHYFALKISNVPFRAIEEIKRNNHILKNLGLPGLSVCHPRIILTAQSAPKLFQQYPNLRYAVLMPWVPGRSWQDIIRERVDLKPRASFQIAKNLIKVLAGMEDKFLAHCNLSGANVLLPGVILFSLGTGFASELDKEQLTDALRKEFQNQKKPLGANATVKAQQVNSKWIINDAGVSYSVRSEWQELNVYYDHPSLVEIVDVEDIFFLPNGQSPANPPMMTSGYSHPDPIRDIYAGRFAGAVLISEILGWCIPQIRQNSETEQYFNKGELQKNCTRYQLLSQHLEKTWGSDVATLFECAWHSATQKECPSFKDWQYALGAIWLQGISIVKEIIEEKITWDGIRIFEEIRKEKTIQDGIRIFKKRWKFALVPHIDRSKKTILDHVSLSVFPGEFVALVGGSGAGKTTLMEILSGYKSTNNKGGVKINGEHLALAFESNRAKMGYVPQNDTLHLSLTVESALRYTAQLRLPTMPLKDIKKRVQEVIDMVKLSDKTTVWIKDLSGGQRKRVSIASEFLSEPSLIFLDEPTSGLDPALDKMLMENILKKQADEGCTILLTTHNTNNILENCTFVAFMAHGHLIYYGPPKEAAGVLQVPCFNDIYEQVKTPDQALQQKGKLNKKYVERQYSEVDKKPSSKSKVSPHLPSRQNISIFLKQLLVLTQRQFNLIWHDPISLAVLVLAMPIIALILSAISEPTALIGKGSNWDQILQNTRLYNPGGDAQKFFFMISLSVVLLGLFASSYEIVKESAVYQRERMINLEIAPYVCSKILVLTIFGLFQVLFLEGIVWLLKVDFPDFEPDRLLFWPSYIEIYITLALAMIASICIGLAISAFTALKKSRDAVIYIILVLLIVQIVCSGALFDIPTWVSRSTPTRWSLETLGAIIDIDTLQGQSHVKVQDSGNEYIRFMQVDLGITYAGHLTDENGNLTPKFERKLNKKIEKNVEYDKALQEIKLEDRRAALWRGWGAFVIFIVLFTWLTIYLLGLQDPAYLRKQHDTE